MTLSRTLAFVTALVMAPLAHAQQAIVTPYDGTFEDARLGLENAIINRGLVIDHVSHVGEMLNRTGEDVGAETKLFEQADIMMFCSATLSREVMEDDFLNIVHCPYGITVAETEDQGVIFVHRSYPDGAMRKVESYLSEIVREASDF
jgi:uncharacterized protein (DUF302 family)